MTHDRHMKDYYVTNYKCFNKKVSSYTYLQFPGSIQISRAKRDYFMTETG
ncbi:hypothetical protein ALC62_12614 [Cyphomyrmex costatus]|uniref:Uncharacterized protein n=1 Tax=Cyphomyrmex costatus TaxID=456900 RepID=A0A195C7K3_9HYME|nr:hypothetical protein ALC62_12614 [Cyphomyrmex costatus]